MNNTIKICLLLLIIYILHPWKLYSSELVITIPDKYNKKSLPLPPFPVESISILEEKENAEEYLNNFGLRFIPLDSVTYRFLPEFLDFNISLEKYTEHHISLYSDLSSIDLTYDYQLYSNLFKFESGGGYLFSESKVDLRAKYVIYNIPIDFVFDSSLIDEYVKIQLGNRDYYSSWGISLGYDTDAFDFDGNYRTKKFFNTNIQLGYHYPDIFSGAITTGWDSLTLGFTLYNGYYYPNMEAEWKFVDIVVFINSELKSDVMNYYISADRMFNNRMELRTGIETMEYSSITPYIQLIESFLWGERRYYISEEELIFEQNFINNKINTIISLNISSFNDYLLSTELVWKDIWSFTGQIGWGESDLSYALGIEYKLEDL